MRLTDDYVNGNISVPWKIGISSKGYCGKEQSEKEDLDAENWELYESLYIIT